MANKRKEKLTPMQDLIESSFLAKGNIVLVTNKNGERYCGIFTNVECNIIDGQYFICLKYAQKLDSNSYSYSYNPIQLQKPWSIERSKHDWQFDLKISFDQLSHMEVCH